MAEPDDIDTTELAETAREIGFLVIAWGVLEDTMATTIAAALEMDDYQERAVVRPMDARAKINLLRMVFKKHTKKQTFDNLVKPFLKEADSVREQRNDIIHGVFRTDGAGVHVLQIYSGASRLDGRTRPMTPDAVKSVTDRIFTVTETFDRIRANLLSSPVKRGKQP